MAERILSSENIKLDNLILRNVFRMSKRTKILPPKVGDKIGSWTIIGAWTTEKGYLSYYRCKCDCGAIEEYVNPSNIKSGSSKQCRSCGQANREETKITANWSNDSFKKPLDQKQKDILIKRLGGMIDRCNTDAHKSKNITVHQQWLDDPSTFVDYITTLPGWEIESLIPDRINTFEGYVPGNIRFINNKENARNRTDTKFLKFEGKDVDIMSFIQTQFGVETAKQNVKLYNMVYMMAKKGQPGENIIKMCKMKKVI